MPRAGVSVGIAVVLVGAVALTQAQAPGLPFATLADRTITLQPSGATLQIPIAVRTAERPGAGGIKRQFTAYLSRPDLERVKAAQPGVPFDEWDGPYSAILNAVLPFEACAVHFGTEPFGIGGGSFADLQTRVYVVDAPAATIVSRLATEGLSQARAKERSPGASVTPVVPIGDWTITTIALTLGGSDYRASARIDFYIREFGRQTVVLVFMYSPNARWPWKAAIDEIVASLAWRQTVAQTQFKPVSPSSRVIVPEHFKPIVIER